MKSALRNSSLMIMTMITITIAIAIAIITIIILIIVTIIIIIIIIIIITILMQTIVSVTKFLIVIGYLCTYLSRNRRTITWVSNYRCPI